MRAESGSGARQIRLSLATHPPVRNSSVERFILGSGCRIAVQFPPAKIQL